MFFISPKSEKYRVPHFSPVGEVGDFRAHPPQTTRAKKIQLSPKRSQRLAILQMSPYLSIGIF